MENILSQAENPEEKSDDTEAGSDTPENDGTMTDTPSESGDPIFDALPEDSFASDGDVLGYKPSGPEALPEGSSLRTLDFDQQETCTLIHRDCQYGLAAILLRSCTKRRPQNWSLLQFDRQWNV